MRHLGPEPEYTCLEEGQASSGFVITVDGKDCRLSPQDVEAWWDYEHKSALPARRAGLGVFVAGLGTGIAGIVLTVRRRKASRAAAQPPAGGGAAYM